MENTVKQRIIEFLQYKKTTVAAFERKCGFSNGYLKNLKDCPTTERVGVILQNYPDLNRIWLLTGEGDMLNNEKTEPMPKQQDTLSRLISVMEKDRQLIRDMAERKDWEIDRLLSIMEADRGIYRKEKTA